MTDEDKMARAALDAPPMELPESQQDPVDENGEVIDTTSPPVADAILESEKSTAWTDAQRDAHVKIAEGIEAEGKGGPGSEITGLELDPGRELTPEERKALPPWAEQLRPGRGVAIDGWVTRIVLIDPARSMLLLFVEGPSQGTTKKVKAAMKKHATKKGSNKTPKGGARTRARSK
jgi:hypothetical protein